MLIAQGQDAFRIKKSKFHWKASNFLILAICNPA